jgi:hypothetical protein
MMVGRVLASSAFYVVHAARTFDAGVSLPECLLVPLYIGETEPLGTLWIVSEEVGQFNKGHAGTLEELACFTGIATRGPFRFTRA